MRSDLAECFNLIPDHLNTLTVSEWAERKRILPRSLTSIPGPFRWANSPFTREIADNLSASSPVQRVAVMKGAQITFTVSVLENWIGYIIDENPGPSMFVGGDRETAQTGIELRVDAMIQSTGLQEKIFSQVEKRHNKKTGDTKSKKEFSGGFLLAIGPNSGAKLRMISIQNLMCDEVDAYPMQVGASDAAKRGIKQNEGDPVALAETRTAAFSSRRKVLYGSTPTVKGQSKIEELFKMGDQRYYHVPCKHCGHMQVLKWSQIKFERDESGRLIFDLDTEGQPVEGTGHVHYECEQCHGTWRNTDKAFFLARGEWRATAEAKEPNFRSYHISSLYSPVGMLPWEKVVLKWIGAQGDLTKLREFFNTVLGECWEERGEAPSSDRLEQRASLSTYEAGTLPPTAKPLIVTLGADIQKDRIEVEIVAWGKDKESWSIEYLTLFQTPDTSDMYGEAWKSLRAAIKAPHGGLYPSMTLIDAGFNTPTVYQFCDKFERSVMPVKGDTNDILGKGLARVYAIREVPGYQVRRVDLDTNYLKQEVYNHLNKGTADGYAPTAPFPGYCHFPKDYGERYFHMLTAEEQIIKQTPDGRGKRVWHQRRARNEALDIRVYAIGALYVVFGAWREQVEENMEARGLKREDSKVSWTDFWQWVEGERKRGG